MYYRTFLCRHSHKIVTPAANKILIERYVTKINKNGSYYQYKGITLYVRCKFLMYSLKLDKLTAYKL